MAAKYILSSFAGTFALVYVVDNLIADQKIFGGTTPKTVSDKQWWLETDKKFQAWPRTTGPPVVMNPITRQNFIVKSSLDQTFLEQDPLNKDEKFKDSVQHFCQQKRLRDVQFLESEAHYHLQILELYCKCASFSDAQSLFDDMGEREHFDIMIFNMDRVVEARKLFDQISDRDNFSWTAMISGSVENNNPENALELFRTMQRNYNFECNKFTVSSALAASAALQSLCLGK